MSLSENILKQAEDYLDDNMSLVEKNAFEALLFVNDELSEHVSLKKEMRIQYNDQDWSYNKDDSEVETLENYLKSSQAQELKATLKKVNDDFVEEKPEIKKNYFSYFAIAASIVILLSYFIFNRTPSNLEIYADYNDWSNLPSLTSRGDSDETLVVQGENAFLEKDYKKAKAYFEEFLTTSEDINANALLYYGITNLELQNNEKALAVFNQLIASETIDYSKGYWYKALTYLKMDDATLAIQELNMIVKNASNYNFKEAKALLKKLQD